MPALRVQAVYAAIKTKNVKFYNLLQAADFALTDPTDASSCLAPFLPYPYSGTDPPIEPKGCAVVSAMPALPR